MSSLEFNFLGDFENRTDMFEATTEPADEGTSTLQPPSAIMEKNRNLPESSSPSYSKNTEQKLLMESPRRRRVEGTARVPFMGTLPKNGKCIIETMKKERDAEWTGCLRGGGLDSSSELRNPVYFEIRSQPTTNAGSP